MSSVNSIVYEQVTELFMLKHREALVFYKLNGFLLRNDIPFPYSSESLAENTVYSKRTIFLALNELEKYQIIERTGLGYNRKFKKGKCLKDIINMSINISIMQSLHGCGNNDQKPEVNNSTTMQSLHRPMQSLHRPVQSLHTGERIENLGKLKDLCAHAILKDQNQTQKPQEFPPYTAEELNLIKKVDDGTEETTDLEKHRARHLKKRHEKKAN